MSICTEAVIVLFFSGLTYHWLLENVPGFCGWQVYAWKEEGISLNDAKFLYKMSFMKYMDMFPEGREIIEKKKQEIIGKKKQETSQCKFCLFSFYFHSLCCLHSNCFLPLNSGFVTNMCFLIVFCFVILCWQEKENNCLILIVNCLKTLFFLKIG